jgi:hypothetical protein
MTGCRCDRNQCLKEISKQDENDKEKRSILGLAFKSERINAVKCF